MSEILRNTFRPPADGKSYTEVHRVLSRIPFRAYVTTNYDEGLLEARQVFRPGVGTGYCTWKDADSVYSWIDDDLFSRQTCPVLFAHGIHQRPDTIVLGAGEYRSAYQPGPFRRLFDKLWSQKNLILVGSSLSDEWIKFLADEVLTSSGARNATGPRHVAFLGLKPEQTTGLAEVRAYLADQFGIQPVFYRITSGPSGEQQHTELQTLLQALSSSPRADEVRLPASLDQASDRQPRQRWIHETTEDEHYVERTDVVDRLRRWSSDPEVRAIAIIGLGGQGKTSLVGDWLKNRNGLKRRLCDGLFFWSFYSETNVDAFLRALLDFGTTLTGSDPGWTPSGVSDLEKAINLISRVPIAIVLDGVEVLQEGLGSQAYGSVTDDTLRRFLDAACRVVHKGLLVLTSRSPFTDLLEHVGATLRVHDLEKLNTSEGAELLERIQVRASLHDRREISRRLEGHPLGLRIFGAALRATTTTHPVSLLNSIFGGSGLRDDDPLERKLARLLHFYDRHLPKGKRAVLAIISLFRTAVDSATLRRLGRRLSVQGGVLRSASDSEQDQMLDELCRDRLILRERNSHGIVMYSCHPVLRDHFRGACLADDVSVAAEFADLLWEKPATVRPENPRELDEVFAAIELLTSAGDFKRADELYRSRIHKDRILLALPAPSEGARCAMEFVATDARRERCSGVLGLTGISFYLNEAALWASVAGDMRLSLAFHEMAEAAKNRLADRKRQCIGHQNHAYALYHMGNLEQAAQKAGLAANIAIALADPIEQCDSRARQAAVYATRGQIGKAFTAYERCLRNGKLRGLRRVFLADLLLRLGHFQRAEALIGPELVSSEVRRYSAGAARAQWILGRVATEKRDFSTAARQLELSEAVMRKGQMLTELPHVLLALTEMLRVQGRWSEGAGTVEEALRIAAPRGLRLAQAEALAARAHLVLTQALNLSATERSRERLLERVHDDAAGALLLARQCGHKWVERDACRWLSLGSEASGSGDQADNYRRELEVLDDFLRRRGALPPWLDGLDGADDKRAPLRTELN